MVWPYLFLLILALPDGTGREHEIFLKVYCLLTLLVYALNIWNAFSFQGTEESLARCDMLVKLVHIPFYIGVFVVGVFFFLAMVVPVFLVVSAMVFLILALVDFFLMASSSMYGVSAVVRLWKKKEISKGPAVMHIALHFIFVADVASAACLYRKAKKAGPKVL